VAPTQAEHFAASQAEAVHEGEHRAGLLDPSTLAVVVGFGGDAHERGLDAADFGRRENPPPTPLLARSVNEFDGVVA
jgi:hypothetical protein